MQADRRAVAHAWLATADSDARAADALVDEPALACFHAQQSAEKALKAAAVVLVGDVERSHSLVRLAREIAEAETPVPEAILRACRILERYYAPTRNPDALGGVDPGEIFTIEDAQDTRVLARDVVRFARAIVETFEAS